MVIAVAKGPMSQQKQPCLKTGQVKVADSVKEKNNQESCFWHLQQ